MVLIELQDYLDFDEIFSIVFQYKMMETIFMFAESKSLDQDRRDAFALEFFRYSLRQEMIDMTVLVQEMYEEHLMRSTNNCVESLIQAFNKSSRHADIKVHILSKYIEFLNFPQVEGILNAIEKFVCGDKSNSYAITNVNPILSCIKIIHMLIQLQDRYPHCNLRTKILIDLITNDCRGILVNFNCPAEIKIMVRRKDLSNRNALTYMEMMDAFQLMGTKVMDRIMKEYWNSCIDTSGSFFQVSTAYQVFKNKEKINLWAHVCKKRDTSKQRSHPFTFQVYLKSMQLRYFFELGVFMVFACLFQNMIG